MASRRLDTFQRTNAIIAKRIRHILDLEERLQRAFACVRESKRLLRTIDDLRANPTEGCQHPEAT